jgi:tetratricopeptide (TPR) repeat protein
LEEAGEFEAARRVLSHLWKGVGVRPNLDGLSRPVAAELLLRVGRLTGWIGGARSVEGAQDAAKDLISEAREIFREVGDRRKEAETLNALGVCYYRDKRAFDEARIYFREAVSLLADQADELSLTVIVNLAMVERADKDYQKAYALLKGVARLVQDTKNHALKARFHNELSLFFKYTGNVDQALIETAACGFHLEQAGHTRNLGHSRNNLGGLLLVAERFEEAHENLEQAEGIFERLGDASGLAVTLETRSRVYLAEKNLEAAEATAARSVAFVEGGDDDATLAENLTTYAKTLARQGRYDAALQVFGRTHELALKSLGSKQAVQVGLAVVTEVLSPILWSFGLPLESGMLGIEGQLIRRALEESGEHLTKAGLMLGLEKNALLYKLKHRHPKIQEEREQRKDRMRGRAEAAKPRQAQDNVTKMAIKAKE